MAKTAGGAGLERLLVDGRDISGNIGALSSIAVRRALGDFTDITQAAYQRQGLMQEGALEFSCWWDGTPSTGVNETFKALRTGAVCIYTNGTALGSPAACLVAHQADYQIPRSPDGTLAATVSMSSGSGSPLEWGVTLTSGSGQPYQTFASAGNGSDVDDLGGSPTSTTYGAILYVAVLSLSGTSVTVKVQDAATLPTYADVTGLTTSAITPAGAPTAVRVASATNATIRRYVRIVTTGTFTNAVVLAALVRPMAAQA